MEIIVVSITYRHAVGCVINTGVSEVLAVGLEYPVPRVDQLAIICHRARDKVVDKDARARPRGTDLDTKGAPFATSQLY